LSLKKISIVCFWIVFLGEAKKVSTKKTDDFAHCSQANKQLKQLNGFFPTELRVQAAHMLMQDLDILRPQLETNSTALPLKLLKVCYDVKRKAFESVFTKGSEELYGNYDFLMTSGRFFFYEQAWLASYNVFEAAAKLQPYLLDPNHYALQAWMMYQLTTEKPFSTEVYLQTSRKYISAMLKAKDVTQANVKFINQYLGILEENSNKIYTARKMKENAVALDPQNLKLRLAWGEFEERNGQFEVASKVYADAIALKSDDQATLKDVYFRLLALMKRTEQKEALSKHLKKALTLFPKEKSFQVFKEKKSAGEAAKKIPASTP
jgi:hypothetical protein